MNGSRVRIEFSAGRRTIRNSTMIRAILIAFACTLAASCEKKFDQSAAESEITAAAMPVGKREAKLARITSPGEIAIESESLRGEKQHLDGVVEKYRSDFPSARQFADNEVSYYRKQTEDELPSKQ